VKSYKEVAGVCRLSALGDLSNGRYEVEEMSIRDFAEEKALYTNYIPNCRKGRFLMQMGDCPLFHF